MIKFSSLFHPIFHPMFLAGIRVYFRSLRFRFLSHWCARNQGTFIPWDKYNHKIGDFVHQHMKSADTLDADYSMRDHLTATEQLDHFLDKASSWMENIGNGLNEAARHDGVHKYFVDCVGRYDEYPLVMNVVESYLDEWLLVEYVKEYKTGKFESRHHHTLLPSGIYCRFKPATEQQIDHFLKYSEQDKEDA